MKQSLQAVRQALYRFVPFKPFLEASWAGAVPLWKVFWFAYVTPRLLSVLLFFPAMLLGSAYPQTVASLYIIITVLVLAWGWHILWRNAKNTRHPFWGYLARLLVIAEFLAILWLAY